LPRELEQSNAGQRLLRTWPNYPAGKRKDQTAHHPSKNVACSIKRKPHKLKKMSRLLLYFTPPSVSKYSPTDRRIERDYQELKQEVGLGHFEGRGWRGFHHHATLCIAAY